MITIGPPRPRCRHRAHRSRAVPRGLRRRSTTGTRLRRAPLPLANGQITMVLVNVDDTPADTAIAVLGGASGTDGALVACPAMLMITDTGSHPQSLRTSMPMADVQVDDTATGQLSALEPPPPPSR